MVENDAVMLPIYHYGSFVATQPYLQRRYGVAAPDYAEWRITRVSTDIPAASGGTLTSSDGQVQIVVGAGDFLEDVTMMQEPATGMPPQGKLAGSGQVFEVTAQYDSGLPATMAPEQTVTMQVSYQDREVRVIREGTLALYYWDGSQWVREPSSVVDTAANTVTANPGHFSQWALFGETERVFVPWVMH